MNSEEPWTSSKISFRLEDGKIQRTIDFRPWNFEVIFIFFCKILNVL